MKHWWQSWLGWRALVELLMGILPDSGMAFHSSQVLMVAKLDVNDTAVFTINRYPHESRRTRSTHANGRTFPADDPVARFVAKGLLAGVR